MEECSAGRFNSQSTSNAWWAVSKLVVGSYPLARDLLQALESALLGCLASPTEAERPNSQVPLPCMPATSAAPIRSLRRLQPCMQLHRLALKNRCLVGAGSVQHLLRLGPPGWLPAQLAGAAADVGTHPAPGADL